MSLNRVLLKYLAGRTPIVTAPLVAGAGWTAAATSTGPDWSVTLDGDGLIDVTDLAAQGSALDWGYGHTPAALFATVSDQDVPDTLEIEIEAYHAMPESTFDAGHEDGIKWVDVSMDNGAWVRLTAPSVAASGNLCWNLTFDAANASDGRHEVRAVVWPYAGSPRVLQGEILSVREISPGLHLNANSGGTLTYTYVYADSVNGDDTTGDGTSGNPFETALRARNELKTIMGSTTIGGGVIYLKAGSYTLSDPARSLAGSPDRWTRITPAPGVTKAEVIISTVSSNEGFYVKRTMLDNLTINTMMDARQSGTPSVGIIRLWANNCDFTGPGRDLDVTAPYYCFADRWQAVFVTNCTCTEFSFGFSAANIADDSVISGIGVDAITNSRLTRNLVIADVDPIPGDHPDTLQLYYRYNITIVNGDYPGSTVENVISKNVVANDSVNAQGPFMRSSEFYKSIAIVNWSFGVGGVNDGRFAFFMWNGNATIPDPQFENVFVRDSSFTNGSFQLGKTDRSNLDTITFIRSTFPSTVTGSAEVAVYS